MTRPTPADAIALIKRFEGWSARPYLCPAGYWTIGYGALRGIDGRPITRSSAPISQADGEMILVRDLRLFERAVLDLIPVPLTEGQYGALVSFTFNLGPGRLKASTLRRRILGGDMIGAADEFGKWVMGGGRRLPGLVSRREAERLLYLRPDPPSLPPPRSAEPHWLARLISAFEGASRPRTS